MDANITLIGSTIVTVIGAVTIATVTIIKATKENRAITVAAQEVGAARGKLRDKKIHEIHILTNSRLTAALKLIMVMAKKELDRTGTLEDRESYDAAKREVDISEESAAKLNITNDEDMVVVVNAEAKLAALTGIVH